MANFDLAAGVSVGEANTILSQYYKSVPTDNNPFKGSRTKEIGGVEITLTWDIAQAPTVAFGPPSQDVWDKALDPKGNTNGADKIPLPSLPMVQLTLPVLDASYSSKGQSPVGGEAKDVVIYATVAFDSPQIKPKAVAVSLDESGFSKWDKAIFNSFLLPQIFASANAAISVITLPALTWNGISLKPPVFDLSASGIVAAATLTTNPSPVDIGGLTWPDDDAFAIASTGLLEAAIDDFAKAYVGKGFSKSGEIADLATYSASGKIDSISATVRTVSPLAVQADVALSGECSAGLTAAGMALAAVGCALGGALLFA